MAWLFPLFLGFTSFCFWFSNPLNRFTSHGGGKVRRQRPVWIDSIRYLFQECYFEVRAEYVESKGMFIDALYPGSNSDGGYMAGNTIRTDKDIVEDWISL